VAIYLIVMLIYFEMQMVNDKKQEIKMNNEEEVLICLFENHIFFDYMDHDNISEFFL